MIHTEPLRAENEIYEIRHDNQGNAVHVIIKDNVATIYPTATDMIANLFFGADTERFGCKEEDLDYIYSLKSYKYEEISQKFYKYVYENA